MKLQFFRDDREFDVPADIFTVQPHELALACYFYRVECWLNQELGHDEKAGRVFGETPSVVYAAAGDPPFARKLFCVGRTHGESERGSGEPTPHRDWRHMIGNLGAFEEGLRLLVTETSIRLMAMMGNKRPHFHPTPAAQVSEIMEGELGSHWFTCLKNDGHLYFTM